MEERKDFFSKTGEVNAFDRLDAIRQIAQYLKEKESFPKVSLQFTAEEREKIISEFKSNEVRFKIGKVMALYLQKFLEHNVPMRKAFKVDLLKSGTTPIYDIDTNIITLQLYQQEGLKNKIILPMEQADIKNKILIPMLEIPIHRFINLSTSNSFKEIDNIQIDLIKFMRDTEEMFIIKVLNRAVSMENILAIDSSKSINSEIDNTITYINEDDINKLMSKIHPKNLFMSTSRYSNLELFTSEKVTIFTNKQIIDTGLVAQLNDDKNINVNVYVSRNVSRNNIYCTADPEYLGVIPVYDEIVVIPANKEDVPEYGWLFSEMLGVGCFQTRGVAKMIIKE